MIARALRAFGDAWAGARTDRSARASVPRALIALGRGCAEGEAIFALALERSRTLVDLVALAGHHAPAFRPALEAARAAKDAQALAMLVRAAPPADRDALFAEYTDLDLPREQGAYDVPFRLATAAEGVDADAVLAAAARVHPYYRALAYALVARVLGGDARAVTATFADEADPSLASAKPFVAVAPYLHDEATCARALALASRLHPSPDFGATALAAILPRWAALGHAEEAATRAREIPVPHERAVALANVGAAAQRDEWILESLPLLEACTTIAPVVASFAALGHASLLADMKGANDEASLLALVRATTGDERAAYALRIAERCEPQWIEEVAREVPPHVLAPRVAWALEAALRVPAEQILEDETGYGLVPWLALLSPAAGDDAATALANVLA